MTYSHETQSKLAEEAQANLTRDFKTITKVRGALAERNGRLSACVYIKEYLEDNGLPPLPIGLRDQLISYCNEPTENITNEDLEVLAND